MYFYLINCFKRTLTAQNLICSVIVGFYSARPSEYTTGSHKVDFDNVGVLEQLLINPQSKSKAETEQASKNEMLKNKTKQPTRKPR